MKQDHPRLVFLTSFEYPSRFAHPIHGLAMARALSRELGEGFLFVYGNKEPAFDLGVLRARAPFRSWVKRLHMRSIIYPLWFFFFARRERISWVLVNDAKLSVLLFLLKPFGTYRVVFEVHKTYPIADLFIYKYADRLVFVTQALRAIAEATHARVGERSVTLPNAVDITAYDAVHESQVELRRSLRLPEGKHIIGYIGRLRPMGADKGVQKLIGALSYLPEEYVVCCVGGVEEETKEYAEIARINGVSDRVMFVAHVPQKLVPHYAKAFDLLAYVPSGGTRFFTIETSPMKLFEYMAAAKPILVSDLPTTREILSDETAFFVASDSTDAEIASRIQAIFADAQAMTGKATAARASRTLRSWNERAAALYTSLSTEESI